MRRPIIFVLLAGVAALVAALVVYSALKKREAEVQQAMVKNVEIVVANHDLSIGTKLDAGSVKLVRWSREAVPPGAYTDPGSVMNQYTKTSFVQNEPIVADRLFAGDKNAGVLPLLIPSGMRAMSVPVDEVSDIAGFVLPQRTGANSIGKKPPNRKAGSLTNEITLHGEQGIFGLEVNARMPQFVHPFVKIMRMDRDW